jgi:plasmid stabilization system protein ParE
MAKVLWTVYAKESLQLTLDFLEVQWGYEYKEELINLIDKRIQQVVLNPNITPVLEGTSYKKLLIHKHLTIFYSILSNTIKILLVWDNRQNPDHLEKTLTSIK